MKKIIFLIILFVSINIFAQNIISLKPGSVVDIDSNTGNMNIDSDMTASTISQVIGTTPPTGGINSFTGPGGCTNCTVAPNTPFNLFWDVQNVSSCTGSNTFNQPDFNGIVNPFGGGSGNFQKSISGLPAGSGTTTFTLNCPVSQTTAYSFNFIAQETTEITIPSNQRMMIYNHGATMILINIVLSNDKNKIKAQKFKVKTISKRLFFTEVFTKNLNELKLNIDNDKRLKLPENVIVWFYLTETDPAVKKTNPYSIGRCDSLAKEPRINISTFSLLKEKTKLDDICSIKPDQKYYLTKVYLKRDMSKINSIIKNNPQREIK